jgi:hypothetical protein
MAMGRPQAELRLNETEHGAAIADEARDQNHGHELSPRGSPGTGSFC